MQTVFKNIAAGGLHSIAVARDGSVWTWGSNEYGQSSGYSHRPQRTPKMVYGVKGAVQVCAGDGFSAVLSVHVRPYIATTADPDGDYLMEECIKLEEVQQVYVWGANAYGQLGVGDNITRRTPVLVRFPEKRTISMLSAGGHHMLALEKEGGTVLAWGSNDSGQLGFPNKDESKKFVVSPQRIPGLFNVRLIAAGSARSAALLDKTDYYLLQQRKLQQSGAKSFLSIDQEKDFIPLYVWGEASALVGSKEDFLSSPHPVTSLLMPTGGVSVSAVICGAPGYIVAINGPEDIPMDIPGFASSKSADEINAARYHSMIGSEESIGDGSSVWAWKGGPEFIELEELNDVSIASIAAGLGHLIIIGRCGNMWMWGTNHFGQLGLGSSVTKSAVMQKSRLEFMTISGESTGVAKKAAAGWTHTLILCKKKWKNNRKMFSFGSNNHSQLGYQCEGNSKSSFIPRKIRFFLQQDLIQENKILTVFERFTIAEENKKIGDENFRRKQTDVAREYYSSALLQSDDISHVDVSKLKCGEQVCIIDGNNIVSGMIALVCEDGSVDLVLDNGEEIDSCQISSLVLKKDLDLFKKIKKLRELCFTNRAKCHFREKNYVLGERDARKAAEINASSISARVAAAKCLFELRSFSAALEQLTIAKSLKPDDTEILTLMKEVKRQLRDSAPDYIS